MTSQNLLTNKNLYSKLHGFFFFIRRILAIRLEMINFWKLWLFYRICISMHEGSLLDNEKVFRDLTLLPVFFEKRLFLKGLQYCFLILGHGIILKFYTTKVHNDFKIIRDNRVVVSSDVPWDRVNCFSNSLSKSFIVGGIGF